MGFLGVYKAVYDYAPQSEGELQITEGDLLFVLDKDNEDDWWKAKKKASAEDEEEPVGLIPNNYVEQVSSALLLPQPETASGRAMSSNSPRSRRTPPQKHTPSMNTRDRPTRSCPSLRMLCSRSMTRQIRTGP